MEKFLALPLLGPILALLKSRKFLVSAATLLVDVLVAQEPKLASIHNELVTIVTLVGSLLVASIAYEDGKEKGAPVNIMPPEDSGAG